MAQYRTVGNMRIPAAALLAGLLLAAASAPAVTITFPEQSGRSGTAEFALLDPTTVRIVLTNTSPTPPSAANGILTSLAFDLPGSATIVGGTATVTAGSFSVDFDIPVAGGDDVSGEYGYGNAGATGFGSLINYLSTNVAGTTPFGGANLDGSIGLDGPQGGIVAPGWDPGGQTGIQDCVTFDLTISEALGDLSFLDAGATIEFGSDDLFLFSTPPEEPPSEPVIPEPITATSLLAFASMGVYVRRRRR